MNDAQVLGPEYDLEEFYFNPAVLVVGAEPWRYHEHSPACFLLHTMNDWLPGRACFWSVKRASKTLWCARCTVKDTEGSLLRGVLQAQVFKKYVTMILTRVNTITGVQYSQDPTIFALELANEPHTTDGYEAARGIPAGSIVREWIMDMVATIRLVDSKHMVS